MLFERNNVFIASVSRFVLFMFIINLFHFVRRKRTNILFLGIRCVKKKLSNQNILKALSTYPYPTMLGQHNI